MDRGSIVSLVSILAHVKSKGLGSHKDKRACSEPNFVGLPPSSSTVLGMEPRAFYTLVMHCTHELLIYNTFPNLPFLFS